MIPKILHQVWLGNDPIPFKFIEWLKDWRSLHPDWEYKLWRDNDLQEIKYWLDKCIGKSSQSNVARLYIISNYGGVYADLDFIWLQNIDSLLVNDAFVAIEYNKTIGNSIFGAVNNHEWINYQINILRNFISRDPPWGPLLMTISTNYKSDKVKILSSDTFYPLSWKNRYEENISIQQFPKSYAVHKWENSWKKQNAT